MPGRSRSRFIQLPLRALAALIGLVVPVYAGWAQPLDHPPRLVIVIDDIGNNLQQGQAALALPGPVTYSVLPHTTYARQLAEEAHLLGKEVMLHAPMASTQNVRLGPGALLPSFSEEKFKAVLNDSLDAVPYVAGVNNHMGSLLTQQQRPMGWVMDIARQRQLFFLDSKTTPGSVAWQTARSAGVPALRRDIFLDHFRRQDFLEKQFLQAVKIARKYGDAVIIGHPYPITTAFLQQAIPALDEAGVQLVSASALIMLRQRDSERPAPPLIACDYREGHGCGGPGEVVPAPPR